jgi:hypothetical protein
MADSYSITADRWESYWLCTNSVGVVDVNQDHALRVAEILSERYPGIIFIWDSPAADGMVMIQAVRPNKRRIASQVEGSIVAAGEVIARNVAKKHPVKPTGLFDRFFKTPLRQGWQYTECQK